MTTVIRANGVQFINDNLPSLSPVVSDGLVAMFRPSNKTNGLADLYNKDNQLTIVGSPELLDVGAKVSTNHYLATNVSETVSSTIITVIQVPVSTSANVLLLSNHDAATKTGQSLFISSGIAKAQVFTGQDAINNRSFAINSGNVPSAYVCLALTVNADSNIISAYNLTAGQHVQYVEPVHGALKHRKLGGIFKLGSANLAGFVGACNIMEAIIYNRALTAEQLKQQYYYSKYYFKKKHNIDI